MTTTLVRPSEAEKPPAAPARRRIRRVGASSFGPLILSVSAALPLGRLITHDVSVRVLVPLVAAIVIADVLTAVAMRFRANVLVAVWFGWIISLCALVLIVDPSLVNPGSSLFGHGSVLWDQLRSAHAALANDGTPLPDANGVIMVFGGIAAAAAALTRGVWGYQRRRHGADRSRRPLSPCLAPSLAIFLYSTLVSAEQYRVAAFVSYFLGILIFIGLVDRSNVGTTSGAGPVAKVGVGTSASSGRGRSRFSAGAAGAAGAVAGSLVMVLVVSAVGAGLSGMRLNVFHVNAPNASNPASLSGQGPSGRSVPEHLITGISLVDHLLATEVTESHTVIFRATSPVTTYWQVGTLSSFNGSTWLPSPSVRDALSGSAGSLESALGSASLPTPTPTQTFTAQVAITDFASRLLPAPPHTVSVDGPVGAATIGEEGVLAPSASRPGTTYNVTAALDTVTATGGSQLAPSDPRLAPYLALPTQPAVVARLAHEAVGTATTPVAEAQALVNWFRSGRFRYTLSPPATTGSDPLAQFLTVTKAGFCEQFAGAYGVLARSLGIPTRLAVGFTAGVVGAGGAFTVTGADAHVWPQVYLGSAAGWVSVEPTPPAVAGSPAAEGVLGASSTGTGPKGARGTTPTTAPPATASPTTPPTTAPSGNGSGARAHHPTHRGSNGSNGSNGSKSGSSWWIPVVVVVGLLLLAAVAMLPWRRRRARAEAALPPDQRVVRAWERALGALRRKGLTRRAEETPGEYAARVRLVEHDSAVPIEADAVTHLAALVELACYTPRPCTPAQATDAHALAARIVEANRSHRRRPPRHAGHPG
jgi:transglutaminase-like putative cysteine protease